MRFIGIDYGEKHIGLAVSDEEGTLAFPISPISNDKQLVDELQTIINDKKIGGIVIGESKDFKGNDNPVMEGARNFAIKIGEATGLPVFFEPEFMTSVEARHIQGGNEKTHSSAAAIILQSFLDKKRD